MRKSLLILLPLAVAAAAIEFAECRIRSQPARFFPGHEQRLEAKTSIREKPQGACTIPYAHNPLYLPENLANFREQQTNDCHTTFPESSQEGKRGKGNGRTVVWNLALNAYRTCNLGESLPVLRLYYTNSRGAPF